MHLALTDLPKLDHLQMISPMFADWPLWSQRDEDDLAWTWEEQQFHEKFVVLDHLKLNLQARCPTILHSSGHLDREFPRWCRSSGLSHHRLAGWNLSHCSTMFPCRQDQALASTGSRLFVHLPTWIQVSQNSSELALGWTICCPNASELDVDAAATCH